mgnify:FL=1
MKYIREYKDAFIVPVFTRESGYWEKVMKPRLQEQGWFIVEVNCAGVDTSHELGRRLLRALGFNIAPDQWVNGFWVMNAVTEADWNDMRQGLFVFYKNFEDLFSVQESCSPFYAPEYALQLAENMVHHYSKFRGNIYEQYPVVVGYGVGLPSSYIPRFEELMGAENVMIAGEGVRYPWSDFEEEQRRNFPNGAPDPLYDKEGIVYGFTIDDKDSTGVYVEDPRYYSESPFYDPVLASKVHLVHSEFDDPE